jgi:hypothetical protein
MTVDESAGAASQDARGRRPGIDLVSVIVPHLDDYDNLDACLTMLAGQSFPKDRTEVIVADNGSSRGVDAVRRIVGTPGQGARRRRARSRTGPECRSSRFAWRRACVYRQRLPAGPALARRRPRRVAVDGFCRRARRRPGRGSGADDGRRSVRERLRLPERALRQEPRLHCHRLDVRMALRVRRRWRVRKRGAGRSRLVPEGAAQGISHRFRTQIDRPASRPPDHAGTHAQIATADARVVRSARRDGKGPIFMLARNCAVLLSIAPHAFVALASKRLSGTRNRILAVGALAQIRAYRFAVAYRAIVGSPDE